MIELYTLRMVIHIGHHINQTETKLSVKQDENSPCAGYNAVSRGSHIAKQFAPTIQTRNHPKRAKDVRYCAHKT